MPMWRRRCPPVVAVGAIVLLCSGCHGGNHGSTQHPVAEAGQNKVASVPVPSDVSRALTRLRRTRRQPIFFLGRHYRGLSLVHVDTEAGPVDLDYADCTYTEL